MFSGSSMFSIVQVLQHCSAHVRPVSGSTFLLPSNNAKVRKEGLSIHSALYNSRVQTGVLYHHPRGLTNIISCVSIQKKYHHGQSKGNNGKPLLQPSRQLAEVRDEGGTGRAAAERQARGYDIHREDTAVRFIAESAVERQRAQR